MHIFIGRPFKQREDLIDIKEYYIEKGLEHTRNWKKYFDADKPVVFTNTSALFKQFENFPFFGHIIENGAHAWAQVFYYAFRDMMWKQDKSKFIFLVSDENLTTMWRNVNAGFTVMLVSIDMGKEIKNNTKKLEKY